MGLRLQALGDLLMRYSEAFAVSWQHRRVMEPIKRRTYEAEFLPSALALQETPVSPLPRVSIWAVLAFALLALLWAIFGRIDIVATAHGKVVPNDRVKVIQPFETASIHRILVKDGQAVQAGDLLVELDATNAHAVRQQVSDELAQVQLIAASERALLRSFISGQSPQLERPDNVNDTAAMEATRRLQGIWAEYQAKRHRIDAEILRREAEQRVTQALVKKLEGTLPIALRRAADMQSLVKQNFVSQHGFLDAEQARIEQEADLASQRSKLIELRAAVAEGKTQLDELAAQTRRASLDNLQQAQQRSDGLAQELRKAELEANRMQLTTPVSGTIQQLAVHTVGGVVTPAQQLMIVVPMDNPLEVEAFLENKDIGFVRKGQDVAVKIDAFPYTKYGTVSGKVQSVSHDAINDEKLGLVYAVKISLDKKAVLVDGVDVRLSPGMVVSAEVKTGKRRVIEYFLAPLVQHTGESMRER